MIVKKTIYVLVEILKFLVTWPLNSKKLLLENICMSVDISSDI